PRLKALAVETGVADRVRFMGAGGREALVDAYRMAGLFVIPSTGGGVWIAFLEAMAGGTPGPRLALAGPRDALADGELGTAVAEPEFVATLARGLVRPQPNSNALAAAVRNRFGHASFAAGTRAALGRLMEAA